MKKWLKIVIITVATIILLFCILIGIWVYQDFQTEKKIQTEVEQIQNILEATDFDEEKLKKKLNTTVSTGDYYKVERSYKNYLRDYLEITNNIINFYKNLPVNSLLSIENIQKDQKEFLNTKLLLNQYKQTVDKLKVNFDSMKTEKKVMSYLKTDLDSYYVDYYKEIVGNIEQTDTEKELSNCLEQSSQFIENIYLVFDFLAQNKDYWTIQNNKVMFSSEELFAQYQNIINNITAIAEKIEA